MQVQDGSDIFRSQPNRRSAPVDLRLPADGSRDELPGPTTTSSAACMPMRPRERAYYRVEYPSQERPTLVSGETEMAVHDLSEHGVRFATHADLPIREGDALSGSIRFRGRGRDELHVEGTVVWVRGPVAALKLEVPIPFATILDEQRYLRTRYRHAE